MSIQAAITLQDCGVELPFVKMRPGVTGIYKRPGRVTLGVGKEWLGSV